MSCLTPGLASSFLSEEHVEDLSVEVGTGIEEAAEGLERVNVLKTVTWTIPECYFIYYSHNNQKYQIIKNIKSA